MEIYVLQMYTDWDGYGQIIDIHTDIDRLKVVANAFWSHLKLEWSFDGSWYKCQVAVIEAYSIGDSE